MNNNNPGVSGAPITITRRQTIRQEQAFLGGGLIIMSTGLFIAQSSYIWFFPSQWLFFGLSTDGLLHAIISWNIAFIVGLAVAAYAVRKFQKDKIYYLSALIVIIGGALMLPSWDSATPLILARYIAGAGQGLAFLPTIIHTSEITPPTARGKTVGYVSFTLVSSILIGFAMVDLFIYVNSGSLSIDQMLGILTFIFGVVSIVVNYVRFIESPVYHLKNNDISSATNCLAKLNLDHPSSPNVANELAHLQDFVHGPKRPSGSFRPFIRVVALRTVYTLSTLTIFNLFTNLFLGRDLRQYSLLVAYLVRFFGEFIGTYTVDKVGRRLLLLISLGGCIIPFAVIGGLYLGDLDNSILVVSGALSIVYRFFLGLGLSHISLLYMGESFTVGQKPFYIFVALLLENVIQILAMVICWYFTMRVAPAYLVMAILQLIIGGFVYWKTPETKGLTLIECRDIME